ncbi:MAG: nucleotide exchange factor GrpE [Dehalococcoidales bacterium]
MTEQETGTGPEVDMNDPEALGKALAKEKEKAEQYLANWQRAQADFANHKRRVEQEMAELGKFANRQLLAEILPAIDDLERAFDAIAPQLARNSWVEGFRLIERKLRATLEAQGLREMAALGKAFDPNFHEAAGHSPGEEGVVVKELQKGYLLHDRVIRPAMVIVGDGQAKGEDSE